MVTAALLLALTAASAGPSTLQVDVPAGIDPGALLELTRAGEIFLLPAHHAHQFKALLITRHDGRCSEMEHAMMDVKGYPKRWGQMREMRIHSASNNRIHYSYRLDLMFSPRLEGIVEHPGPGHIRFVSEKQESDFSWMLHDVEGACHMVHHMVQPPGVRSDFVDLVGRLESGTGDAAELAGALAAARGYAKPGVKGRTTFSPAALEAWDQLSGGGTVLHLINRPDAKRMLIRARRRVDARPLAVAARIRDRAGYVKGGVDFLSDVEREGRETIWSVAYFGGRVSFTTAARERGTPTSPSGLHIAERVVAGDLKDGSWVWTVRAVDGGTAVDLEVDLDVTEGSMVLRTLAEQDPLLQRTNAMQVALEFMRVVVPGRTLPTRPLLAGSVSADAPPLPEGVP